MVTISNLVHRYIMDRPFFQEALSKGILNNAALAEELMPALEKELGKKVKFSAVNMAIRRLGEQLSQSAHMELGRFDNRSDLSVKTNLFEVTFIKTQKSREIIKRVYAFIDMADNSFFTITHGMSEITLIASVHNQKEILALIPQVERKAVIAGLNSITVSIPLKSTEHVGLFYVMCRALAWENVPIVEFVSTLTESTFVIKEKDTMRAFEALKNLIEKNKK
ncbi:MAG TPA: hypothetical protein VJI75_02075 [Candidatus Nanoarchaeia archaeon]|nr:hypothetical protein [Candidatus Nanoarchaeia archaeon]